MTYYLAWAVKLIQITFPHIHAFEQLPIIPLINKVINYVYFKKRQNPIFLAKKQLTFVITHLCNKKCYLCGSRIQTSFYKYLTKEEYEYLVSCIQNSKEITSIRITGGEPLYHPFFSWLIGRMLQDFPNARLLITTNGRLLPTVKKELFDKLTFKISHYPTWNDTIIKKYLKYPNIHIIRYKRFWNIYRDSILDENTAKEIRRNCHFHIFLVATRLYNCCNAEGIERVYQTEPVHIQFDVDWQEKILQIPTWKACQHCFNAMDFINNKKLHSQSTRVFPHHGKKRDR